MHESNYIYVKYLFENDRPISSDLFETLAVFRNEQKAIDKLLKSIEAKKKANWFLKLIVYF